MSRDTCVVVNNISLYEEYQQQLVDLKNEVDVMDGEAVGFDEAFARHREQHNRNQAALQLAQRAALAAARGSVEGVPSFEKWLDQGFLTIPLFIWEETHTEAVTAEADKIVYGQDAVAGHASGYIGKTIDSNKRPYRDFLTEASSGSKTSFDPNAVVIATKTTGAYMRFMQLDIVKRNPELDLDFMIELRKSRYVQPFEITPEIKGAIVRLIKKAVCKHYAIPVEALRDELRLT